MLQHKINHYNNYFWSPPAQSRRQETRLDIQNYGCNGNLLCDHGVVERTLLLLLRPEWFGYRPHRCRVTPLLRDVGLHHVLPESTSGVRTGRVHWAKARQGMSKVGMSGNAVNTPIPFHSHQVIPAPFSLPIISDFIPIPDPEFHGTRGNSQQLHTSSLKSLFSWNTWSLIHDFFGPN